jgi:hypothetical protein
MGLIIVTHLGPGIDRADKKAITDRAKSFAGSALLNHIRIFEAKGFQVSSVTSDPELKTVLQQSNITLNVLGRVSHAHHAESAIRHLQNKARSTAHSLPYTLPGKWAPILVTFVVYTANMVPKTNSPYHTPAYTLFTGLMPNFKKQTPHPFGIAGFLQHASGPRYNSAEVIAFLSARSIPGPRCVTMMSPINTEMERKKTCPNRKNKSTCKA